MSGKAGKRAFGWVRRLPSGRYQASYLGPNRKRHTARTPEGQPLTFDTKKDADGWLSVRQSEILRNAWLPPAQPKTAPVTLASYSPAWLAARDLGESTRELYRGLLDAFILPAFGKSPLSAITPAAVREWYAKLATKTGPTRRAHAYSLLRTILNTAVEDEVIAANPCRIRGAGQAKRARTVRPATLPELEALVKALPDRYRLMALLAAWCALRFGELAELRRSDIDVTNGIIHVKRGVVRPGNQGRVVKDPKSEAGKRDVAIPPHLMPVVKAHLRQHVPGRQNALLFPSAHDPQRQMAPSALYAVFFPARDKAGRPDLNFHDLRHTGATLAAVSGATIKELMARLGHSTPSAAMIYQHAAADRDKVIAEALSRLADATVVPITRAKGKQHKGA